MDQQMSITRFFIQQETQYAFPAMAYRCINGKQPGGRRCASQQTNQQTANVWDCGSLDLSDINPLCEVGGKLSGFILDCQRSLVERLCGICLLNTRYVVAQWSYFSSHTDVLGPSRIKDGPKSDQRENKSHPCAQRTLHPFCVVFHTCMVAEPVFLELGY